MAETKKRSPFTKYEVANIRDKKLLADIPRGAERVFFCLGLYIDDKGKCFPSQVEIATQLRMSIRAVIEQIKKLVGAGLIQIKKERVRGVCFRNVYFLKPGYFSYGMTAEDQAAKRNLDAFRKQRETQAQGVYNGPWMVNGEICATREDCERASKKYERPRKKMQPYEES